MVDYWKNLTFSSFSHIYYEKDALSYDLTKKILKLFDNSKKPVIEQIKNEGICSKTFNKIIYKECFQTDIFNKFANSSFIEISHYKDVFNQKNQNFVVQKKSPNLILAVNKEKFIYKGSKMCNGFDNEKFYYSSQIKNCFYDCEYCYLQGIYPSANIVIYVNIDDAFKEMEAILEKEAAYVCISYDTDLLAFENITGYVGKWLEFAKKHNNLSMEVRTKSSNFALIKHYTPNKNVIFAWTISPDEIIEKFEHGTPNLKKRLDSIKECASVGWSIRLCFDPLIFVKNWKIYYKNMVKTTFENIENDEIFDVSIGVFRTSVAYLKEMEKHRQCSEILAYPFEKTGTYSIPDQKEIIGIVVEEVEKYIDFEKIKVY